MIILKQKFNKVHKCLFNFLKNIINCLTADKKYKIYVPSSEIVNSKQTKFLITKWVKLFKRNFVNSLIVNQKI